MRSFQRPPEADGRLGTRETPERRMGVLRVPVAVVKGQGVYIRSFYLDTKDQDAARSGLLLKKYNPK